MRPVTFQHIRTRRVIEAKSVAEFARKAGLGVYGKYQMDDVLKGKRLHRGGWALKSTLTKSVQFKDIYGRKYSGEIADLLKRLSARAVWGLAQGKRIGDLAPLSYKFPVTHPLSSQTVASYTVFANGRQNTEGNIWKLSETTGIQYQKLHSIIRGKKVNREKGIRLVKVRMKERPLNVGENKINVGSLDFFRFS